MNAVTRAMASAAAVLTAFALSAPIAAQDDISAALQGEEEGGEKDGFDATYGDTPKPPIAENMSPDKLIVFFTTFAQNEDIVKGLRPAMDALLVEGEKVEDWQDQGIDILAHLATREGGVAGNILRDTDVEVLSAIDLSGGASPDLEPFESYALRPDPIGLVAERGFISFLPGVWFEVASQRSQVGNALCYGGYFGVTMHIRSSYTRWSDDQLIGIASIFALIDQLSALDVCTLYSLDEEGRYISRSFLPDGTDLPALNAQNDPSFLMPAVDLDEFLLSVPKVDRSK
ncbi:MAG: hypothetical protein AAF291_08545 [Pseudomonadota bacterium]